MIDRRMIDRRMIDRRTIDTRMVDRRMINRQMIGRRTDRQKINIYLEFFQRSLPLTALTAVTTEHSQALNLFPR
jgi:hypothetical protein